MRKGSATNSHTSPGDAAVGAAENGTLRLGFLITTRKMQRGLQGDPLQDPPQRQKPPSSRRELSAVPTACTAGPPHRVWRGTSSEPPHPVPWTSPGVAPTANAFPIISQIEAVSARNVRLVLQLARPTTPQPEVANHQPTISETPSLFHNVHDGAEECIEI
eukprot:gene2677-biopygen11609